MSVELGKRYSDSISGFTGIATARTVYLYGCVRVLLTPDTLGKDGVPLESQGFDEQRVDPSSEAATGGPQSDIPAHPIP